MPYVPILKAKQGELLALRECRAEVLGAILPLVEVPPIPPKYLEGEDEPVPSKSIAAHADAVAKAITDAWTGSRPILVDGFYIEEEEVLDDGSEPIARVFQGLRDAEIQFRPVVGLDRLEEYADAVRAAVEADGRGCCLRLQESDLESIDELGGEIDSITEHIGVEPSEVDLLVDFGPHVPSKAAIPYQIRALPRIGEWRSLILASSSFPRDMSGVPPNSLVELERAEWLLWTFLRSKKADLPRLPDYADHAINHPEISEIDPRIMRMSPNIRYTSELHYVIAKGAALPRKKDRKKNAPASEQYPEISTMIIDHRS